MPRPVHAPCEPCEATRSYSWAREHVEDLVDPVFAGDAGIVLGGRDELAFLQNPDRADVVLGHEGKEWPLFEFGDEGGEGSSRNAPAPELAPDPVADQPPILDDPASDVPSHLPIADDRADDVRGVAAELGPMCHEGFMIPRRKGRHPHGYRVALVLEEDRQVGVDDIAQGHFHTSRGQRTEPAAGLRLVSERIGLLRFIGPSGLGWPDR
jgi:hypothetical protein